MSKRILLGGRAVILALVLVSLLLPVAAAATEGETSQNGPGASPASSPPKVQPRIVALHLTSVTKDLSYDDHGVINLRNGMSAIFTVYGVSLLKESEVKFTTAVGSFGNDCDGTDDSTFFHTQALPLFNVDEDGTKGQVVVPESNLIKVEGDSTYYVCLKSPDQDEFFHQGRDKGITVVVYDLLLPVWLMIVFIIILLCLSGLFSGLNLGLMALDQTELKIVQNTGSENERRYAKKIAPIRAHGNFLLCSLLLGNVLVNNTLTILLDTLTSGLVAVIGATMGIVIFGEIIPQSICSRHGLAVGAHTILLTKFFMLLTFPLSFPISILLDKLLGQEIGTVYDRVKLVELLKVTDEYNDMEKDEVDIVTGALVYKDKTVCDIMTRLEDCFMLPLDAVLDFDTVSEIREQGYSRIPVYDGARSNIVHVLFAKDLMFVDPDDCMAINAICGFYRNDVNFVFQDTPLNIMFNEFKSGEKGHMAFVQDVNTQGEGDPYYETIGLVTLEDIIEEIIQQEIVDETDVITDNRTKQRRNRQRQKEISFQHQDPLQDKRYRVTVSPHLALAIFQFLSTSVDPFRSSNLNETVLKKLLTFDVFREIKLGKERPRGGRRCNESECIIMEKGKGIDFFILIVEGRVEVNIGREELIFESGPFSYFGIQTLTQLLTASDNLAHAQGSVLLAPSFTPDYTVKALTDVLYLCINRPTYLAAMRASQMSRNNPSKSSGNVDLTDRELDRLLSKAAETAGNAMEGNNETILMRTISNSSKDRPVALASMEDTSIDDTKDLGSSSDHGRLKSEDSKDSGGDHVLDFSGHDEDQSNKTSKEEIDVLSTADNKDVQSES